MPAESNDATTPAGNTPGLTPPPAMTPVAPAPVVLPPENFPRGVLLALLAIPAGVIVFGVIYNFGYITGLVGFGIAFAAFFLYRLGSGGRVSIKGAVAITVITLLTIPLSVFLAQMFSIAQAVSSQNGESLPEVITDPHFFPFAMQVLGSPDVAGQALGDYGLAFLFGVLGCAGVILNVFRTARSAAAPPAASPFQTPPVQPPAA